MTYRQTGVTTQQMKDAPFGSVYVWCNGVMNYPRKLSQDLGRKDLQIKPLSWLTPQNLYGRTFATVVIDHAARLDSEGLEALEYLRIREATH
jgi:hypothetical protein